jgi:peptide/nickel transport system permease protein
MTFILRRLGFYAIAAWVAITLNFLIPRLMPGNPVEVLFSRIKHQISPQAVQAISLAFGLNTQQGLFGQYLTYLNQLFHGNLGVSVTYFPATVASVLRTALPWTIALVGIATVLSFAVGTLLGIVSAWRRGSTWADSLLPVTAFLAAVPYFWLGLVVLTLFAVDIPLLPIAGGYSASITPGWSWAFISSALVHGILPAVTIVVSSIAGWLLGMRNVMISTLSDDYVLLAEAKGLRQRRVIFTYAARNAILPNVASFALSLGFIVGGAILTEVVFSYPGVGYVLYQAVSNNDYPLMQGVFLTITFLVLIANLLADACYVLLDPRTRESGR